MAPELELLQHLQYRLQTPNSIFPPLRFLSSRNTPLYVVISKKTHYLNRPGQPHHRLRQHDPAISPTQTTNFYRFANFYTSSKNHLKMCIDELLLINETKTQGISTNINTACCPPFTFCQGSIEPEAADALFPCGSQCKSSRILPWRPGYAGSSRPWLATQYPSPRSYGSCGIRSNPTLSCVPIHA